MLHGDADKAMACYEQSLAADPKDPRPHLSMAAALLVNGDDDAAEHHLAEFVRANPDKSSNRLQHAELLLRMKRLPEASAEFERVVADAQLREDSINHLVIHCQTRLMEIAESQEDEYALHLHRGIGIYYIACQRARLGQDQDQGKICMEALLCQAAGELALARLARPLEARPCWYLYEVWTMLDQRKPALHNLREADANATFSYLTATEKSRLNLARMGANPENTARR